MTAEELAQSFHEAYERLAPSFGYKTREASAKPWADVPEQNRALMVAVCTEVMVPKLAAAQAETTFHTESDRAAMEETRAVHEKLAAAQAEARGLREALNRICEWVAQTQTGYDGGDVETFDFMIAARAALTTKSDDSALREFALDCVRASRSPEAPGFCGGYKINAPIEGIVEARLGCVLNRSPSRLGWCEKCQTSHGVQRGPNGERLDP